MQCNHELYVPTSFAWYARLLENLATDVICILCNFSLKYAAISSKYRGEFTQSVAHVGDDINSLFTRVQNFFPCCLFEKHWSIVFNVHCYKAK